MNDRTNNPAVSAEARGAESPAADTSGEHACSIRVESLLAVRPRRAVCACGWASPLVRTDALAEAQFAAHMTDIGSAQQTEHRADPQLMHAEWCGDWCEGPSACMSNSDARTVIMRGAGQMPDERGVPRDLELRTYLLRSVGWGSQGMTDDVITAVHLILNLEGWTGGDDVTMTVEQARAVAGNLLNCAERASVDRARLLADGLSVAEATVTQR